MGAGYSTGPSSQPVVKNSSHSLNWPLSFFCFFTKNNHRRHVSTKKRTHKKNVTLPKWKPYLS